MNKFFTRRTLLRGAGVALALPWFESLLPRGAVAQAAAGTAPVRYLPIYLPNGVPEFWVPNGTTSNWTLGSILEPLSALKSKVTVLKNLENGSAFNDNGSASVEPSHGRQPGAWLTCVDGQVVRKRLGTTLEANGVSVDQVMALHAAFADSAIPSLQVGLSTVHSSCDGGPGCGAGCQCSVSRSISWHTQTQPMYKKVDPLTVFNIISTAAMPGGAADPVAADKRRALKKSILDGALDSATSTRARLSVADQKVMDQFLDSVRAAELKASKVSEGMDACAVGARPSMATVTEDGIRQTTAKYSKADHADAMNALIVLAFQCNVTRLITYMLEDERSEFVYDHVQKRKFTADTSTLSNGTCPEYHTGGQHGTPDDFASITQWNVSKVADLCKKLDAIQESNGASILDNSVVFLGSCMHGSDHACDRLPALLIGSGGGKLKTNQYISLNKRPLRDLHFTMMNSVFDMKQTDFGQNLTGAPISIIQEIVA